MKEVRNGTHRLYKGEYIIVFYDKTDDYLLYMFDNVRDVLRFMNKPITRNNVTLVNTIIARALKTETHFTRFLTGEVLRVHIINVASSDEDDEKENEYGNNETLCEDSVLEDD